MSKRGRSPSTETREEEGEQTIANSITQPETDREHATPQETKHDSTDSYAAEEDGEASESHKRMRLTEQNEYNSTSNGTSDSTSHSTSKPSSAPSSRSGPHSSHSHSHSSYADRFELRVLVDGVHVGAVLGRGGSNVQRIRDGGVSVNLIAPVDKGLIDRVMMLKGSVEVIAAALRTTAELIIESSPAQKHEPTFEMKLLVHRAACGAIIGERGERVRATQQETGAKINISPDVLGQSSEKCVSIIGLPNVIESAALIVLKQLQESPMRSGTKTVLYVPYPPGPGNYPPPPGYGMPPYGYPPAPHGYGGGYGGGYPNADPYSGYYGASPYGAPPAGAYGAPPAPYGAAPGAGAGVGGPAAAPRAPRSSVTQKIAIPTVCAGCVIGRGGTIIKELREKSGCAISVGAPEATAPNERVVTIVGTQEAIEVAIQLIRQQVESYTPGPPPR